MADRTGSNNSFALSPFYQAILSTNKKSKLLKKDVGFGEIGDVRDILTLILTYDIKRYYAKKS